MEMKYEFGYPAAKRIAEIKELVEKTKEYQSEEYMGQLRKLPVIEIRIGAPIYRLENIRTINAQKEWLALNKDKPRDYFVSEPGAIEVQQTQHSLLKKIVTKDGLIEAFKFDKSSGSARKQKYPLIISDEGVVVNGNCRLCAWRELYYSDPEKYSHLQTVRVAVLPNHDPAGMYELEVSLQLGEPEKEDYVWHAIAADSKAKYEQNVDIDVIARRRNMKTKELNTMIEAYEYAASYLESIGSADVWSLVDNQYYAFRAIVLGRKNLNKPGEKALFAEIAKSILSQPAKDGRLYDQIPKVVKNLNLITPKLKEVFDIESSTDEPDEISLLLGGDVSDQDAENAVVAAGLEKADNPQLVVKTVVSVIETADEIEKEKKKSEYIFEQVRKAATELNNAVANIDDRMSKDGVSKQIENIKASLVISEDWIK